MRTHLKPNPALSLSSPATGVAGRRAFTLLELLIVIGIIAVLAGLLLPVLSNTKERARRIRCVANLKQIVLAMHEFSADFELYPWRVPPSEGGSQTMTQASRTFQVMSNYVATTELLVCPSDQRQYISSMALMRNTNVSYFVGVEAQEHHSSMVIAGDRNIEGGRLRRNCPVAKIRDAATEFTYVQIPRTSWSSKIHRANGNIALSDGSAQQVNSSGLREMFLGSGDEQRAFNNHILSP